MIKCKESQKVYIGQSKNIIKRFKVHRYDLKIGKHGNQHMMRSYQKYGKDIFDFSIIEFCEIEKLNEREDFWVKNFDSMNPDKGFNKMLGPYKGLGIKEYDSPEFKKAVSDTSKKRWQDPEFKEKNLKGIRQAHEERKARGETLSILTEESKKKSRASCSTPEFLQGLSQRTYKQLENPEYRALALKNLEKGRNSPITKEKIKKFRERQRTPEYKAMMAAKIKTSWDDPIKKAKRTENIKAALAKKKERKYATYYNA